MLCFVLFWVSFCLHFSYNPPKQPYERSTYTFPTSQSLREVKSLTQVVGQGSCPGLLDPNTHRQPPCCAAVLSPTTPSTMQILSECLLWARHGEGDRDRSGPCSQSLQIRTIKFSLGSLIFYYKKRVQVIDIPSSLKAYEHLNYLQWLLCFHFFIILLLTCFYWMAVMCQVLH